MPPGYLLLSLILVCGLVIILGVGSALMSRLIGILYPILKSIHVLENKEKEEEAKRGKEKMTVLGLTDEIIEKTELEDMRSLLKCKVAFRVRF